MGQIFPSKGRDTMDTPHQVRDIDYSIGGKLIKGGVRLYHVNTDYWKRWIHSRVNWPPEAETGGWHLHNATTESYCRQIVAEEMVIKASGKAVWVRKSKENHYLDCEVLAACAAHSLGVQHLQAVPDETTQRVQQAQKSTQPGSADQYKRNRLF